jgi:hypothetical protein
MRKPLKRQKSRFPPLSRHLHHVPSCRTILLKRMISRLKTAPKDMVRWNR